MLYIIDSVHVHQYISYKHIIKFEVHAYRIQCITFWYCTIRTCWINERHEWLSMNK